MATEELKVVISAETDAEGFSKAEQAIKDVGDATQEASEKMKTISEVVEEQSEYLKELRQKYIDLAAAGEHDWVLAQEIQDVTKELEANKKALADAEKQLQKYDGSMDTIAKAAAQQEAELKKLKDQYIEVVAAEGKNSDSAKELAKEIQDLSSELKDNKKAIADAEDEYGKLDATMKDSKKQFEEFSTGFTKIGDVAKAGLKTAATAAAGVTTAFLALGPATQEYRQNQAQLNAAFEQASMTTEAATATYRELYKVIGDDDQAVESAANIAMLASSEQEAAKWAELASGVLGTFHDTLQPEAFYEAANETLKLGEATGAFTQMLEQTGVMSVEEFNAKLAECTTEAEKQALMLQVSSDAMGAAGAAYDEATASIQAQRDAQASMSAALAELGAAAEPVVTVLSQLASEVLAELAPHVTEFAESALPKIKEVLTEVGDKIGDVIGWIVDNWELVSTIATIILGIAAAISVVSTGLTAYNTVMAITSAVSLPMIGTIAAVTAGIALLVAGIVIAVKHWDEIKAKASEVWDNIKTKTSEAVENVKQKLEDMKKNFVDKVENIKQNVTEKFEAIKTNIQEKINAAKEVVTTIFGTIANNIKGKIEFARDIIKNVLAAIKGIFTGDLGAVKTAATNIFDAIKDSIKNKIEAARDFVKGAIEKIKGFFNFKWELPKLKLPHFSITGEFSLNPPSIPKISVDWYQKGGVFDYPTLFGYGNGGIGGLGENGAEAIVPLEKNTYWLDRMADMLAAKMGTGTPIVLEVDGKAFAQTTIKTLNDFKNQTGTLPLIV